MTHSFERIEEDTIAACSVTSDDRQCTRNRFRDWTWDGQIVLLLLPFLIGVFSLIFLPALLGLPLAFTSYSSLDPPEFNGLENFRELWNDRVFHRALRNTLFFIAVAVPLRLLCALAIALLLLPRSPGVGAMRAAILLPTVVPDIAWALAWLWILNPLLGPLNLMLRSIGIGGPAWMLEENGARFAIVLLMTWQFGEGFVVCLGALSDIPAEILEQSRVDGANRQIQFLTVTLPLISPYLLLLVVRDTLFSLYANFVPAMILGQDGGPNYATTYLPTRIYINAFGYLRLGYAAAMTWATFVFTLMLLLVSLLVLNRLRSWVI